MSPLKKVLRVMGWVLATSWMYTYRDFKLVHREEWKEDEFLDFWIPHRQGELNFIGIVVSLPLSTPILVLRLLSLTFKREV